MFSDCSLKALNSPASNELIQTNQNLTFKLLKTVADFSHSLATLHDNFGHELQMLVETFRKRNGELRKERLNCPNSLFNLWELFLQQVEVNSQQHGDISRYLGQSIGQGLIERVFHKKIQSKKVFSHRDRIEAILLKSNELLHKCYQDYCQSYTMALKNPAQFMSDYIGSHNVYVHQLQATNGMIHAYQTKTLPKLLEELEECQLETSGSISSSLMESSEVVSEKASEQSTSYRSIAATCRQASPRQDLAAFVKAAQQQVESQQASSGGLLATQQLNAASDLSGDSTLSAHNDLHSSDPLLDQSLQGTLSGGGGQQATLSSHSSKMATIIRYHHFQAPNAQLGELEGSQFDPKSRQMVPILKHEIAADPSQPLEAQTQKPHVLDKDRETLEEKMEKLEERIEALGKLLARNVELKLHNKVNEIQEEICQRRYELYVAQIHLSAVRAQLQLFEFNFRPNMAVANLAASLALASESANSAGGHHQGSSALGGGASLGAGNSNNGGHFHGDDSSQSDQVGNSQSGGQLPLGYKNKWIKAFSKLRDTSTPASNTSANSNITANDSQRLDNSSGGQTTSSGYQTNAANSSSSGHHREKEDNQHFFQEYTFKKIASCDVCKDFLRGHMRQGVKCKLCKISCHNECTTKAHSTIKCQQAKMKLLRRQKSAGELELVAGDAPNAGSDSQAPDASERSNQKPDGIYQLIRQILDAKKRGQAQQQQQHQNLNINNNEDHSHRAAAAANNLTLASQSDGKSVSTSALGNPANVDRWGVVMELLAESRKREKEQAHQAKEQQQNASANQNQHLGAQGKRNSKQLDKFKLAAQSAAAATKHQRSLSKHLYHVQQQNRERQQQQQQQAQIQEPTQAGATSDSGYLDHQSQSPTQQHQTNQAQQPQMSYNVTTHNSATTMIEQAAGYSLSSHHAYGLATDSYNPPDLVAAAAIAVGQDPQQDPHLHQHQVNMYQQHQNYQMLNVGPPLDGMQSTSAPHSPERKRFNLRMKSFSLDSPDTAPSANSFPGASTQQQQHLATNSQAIPQIQHHSHYHDQDQDDNASHEDIDRDIEGEQQSHSLAYEPQPSQQSLHSSSAYLYGGPQMHHYLPDANIYQHRHSYHSPQQMSSHVQLSLLMSAGQAGGANEATSYEDAHHHYEQQHQQHLLNHHSGFELQVGAPFQHHSHHLSSSHNALNSLQFTSSSLHSAATNANNNNDNLLATPAKSGGLVSGNHRLGSLRISRNKHEKQQQQQQQMSNKVTTSAGSAPTTNIAGKSSSSSCKALKQNNISNAANPAQRPDCYYDLGLDAQQQQQRQQKAGQPGKQQISHPQGPIAANQQQQRHQMRQAKHQQAAGTAVGGVLGASVTSAAGPNQSNPQQQQQQRQQQQTYVVLYDYLAQRSDELSLAAGQYAAFVGFSEPDWWQVRALDGTNRCGYFPASYLSEFYPDPQQQHHARQLGGVPGETTY